MEDRTSGLTSRACWHCPASQLAICREAVAARGARVREVVEQSVCSVSARRMMFRGRDLHDIVPVICDGWATRDVRVSGGGRMILSLYLPGEMIGDALFIGALDQGFFEAITDVEYRTFERSAMRSMMFGCAEAFEILLHDWVEEKKRSDRLIVDLGRHSAEVRVARLIQRIVERLKERELEEPDAQQLAFPLRHHHIADATGLTSVHVTKVLSELRRRHVLDVSGRTLSILDPIALNRIAGE